MTLKHSGAPDAEHPIQWGKVGIALLLWAIVGWFTGIYYDQVQQQRTYQVIPKSSQRSPGKAAQATAQTKQPDYQIGPLIVDYPGEVHEIAMRTLLPVNFWTFIEIEITDNLDNYLFSMGKELYYETGRDSDGRWTEKRMRNSTKITFPEPGLYYLNFASSSKQRNYKVNLTVKVKRYRGSSVGFYSLAIVLAIIGFLMIEFTYRPVRAVLERLE